jgi:hypothetical protein
MKFSSFLDIKNKQTKKELGILKEILSNNNFQVEDFTSKEEPYIYLKSTDDAPFQGVRIYKIGSNYAYRIQNESETQPYGQAYPINLEEIFNDIIPDMTEEEAAETVASALAEEFHTFFKKSAEFHKDMMISKFDKQDIAGSAIISSNEMGDFSNSIYNK